MASIKTVTKATKSTKARIEEIENGRNSVKQVDHSTNDNKMGVNGALGMYSAKNSAFIYLSPLTDVNYWRPFTTNADADSVFAKNARLQSETYELVQRVSEHMIANEIQSVLLHSATLPELGIDESEYPVFSTVYSNPEIRCIRLTYKGAKSDPIGDITIEDAQDMF